MGMAPFCPSDISPVNGFFAQHRRFVVEGGMSGGCLAFRVEFGVSGVFLRGSTAFDGVPERSESCASEAGPYVCGAARLPSMLPARVRFQAVLLIRTSNSFFARPS